MITVPKEPLQKQSISNKTISCKYKKIAILTKYNNSNDKKYLIKSLSFFSTSI